MYTWTCDKSYSHRKMRSVSLEFSTKKQLFNKTAVESVVRYRESASSAFDATDRRLCRRRCASVQPWRRLMKQEALAAIAEEPRDALRQLKYYGRFLTELLTRSSANPEEPCEHTVSWNLVNGCTNVRRIACGNVCNRWMTFKVIQGHCRCHHLIGHILFHISLPL